MTRSHPALLLALLALLMPACAAAQSDDGPSLGDLARAVRKSKMPSAAPAIIDNDNFAQVMDQVETRRLNGSMSFTFNPAAKNFDIKVPDATCSLSFNANASALLTDPYVPVDLPRTELTKLDGPAVLDGDTLQVSVYNATQWDLNEITVSLTTVRLPEDNTAYLIGGAKLVPAAQAVPAEEKRSDTTVLLHLKGRATPFTTAIFREKLEAPPGLDQDWHWAIVQARGVPPTPPAPAPGY
jgi:hypothetical protein